MWYLNKIFYLIKFIDFYYVGRLKIIYQILLLFIFKDVKYRLLWNCIKFFFYIYGNLNYCNLIFSYF